jgi:hypothetical protein
VQTTTSGFVLWFTGLSGARNSTLSRLVATEIERRGVHVEVLDGDEVRETLSKGLGFSKEDRVTNIRRIGFVAKVAARCGACAIVAAISPYREIRHVDYESLLAKCSSHSCGYKSADKSWALWPAAAQDPYPPVRSLGEAPVTYSPFNTSGISCPFAPESPPGSPNPPTFGLSEH